MSKFKSALVRLAVSTGCAAFALKVRRSNPLILMYHGVSSTNRNESMLRNCESKHTAASLFNEHLTALRKSREVISLDEMTAGLRSGHDLSKTVAITFDDGYRNNFSVAADLLTRHKMSATFFLATGFIDTEQLIWTDKLELVLDRTSRKSLRLDIPPLEQQPQQPRQPRYDFPLVSHTEKRVALRALKAALKKLNPRQLADSIAGIEEQLQVNEVVADGDYLFMTWNQARALTRAGFEVGAHTMTHPILSRISDDDARIEILGSRDRVYAELGQCSSTFCYPNGKHEDYTRACVDICQSHFKAALSTTRGAAHVNDMFELKRFGVGASSSSSLTWTLLRER